MSSSSPSRWTKEKAARWYEAQPWLVGFNYVPSYACNTTEWWQEESFRPDIIARELGWAAEIGYNTTRVFIQYVVWKHSPGGFKARFDRFLLLAQQHGISVMPVLFDDCTFGEPKQLDPFLGAQRPVIAGMTMPSWTPSPGRRLGADPAEQPALREYVQDMLRSFGGDRRVLAWDLFNEPMNVVGVGTPDFLRRIFDWGREAKPGQPITNGVWNDNAQVNEVMLAHSDIITFHAYTETAGLEKRIAEFQRQGYPVICTEWMARDCGSRFDTDLPMFRARGVGCYQWGLVNGRTQTQFSWYSKPGAAVDEKVGWHHDILHADGTPYRPLEIEAIKVVLARPN